MKKLFTLFAVAVLAFAANANVLTVAEGTATNSHYPFYGLYYDTEGTTSQVIYPADMLTDMVGCEITEIKFITRDAISLNGGNLAFSLKVVEQTEFASSALMELSEEDVCGQAVPVYGETEFVLTPETPFLYEGGNLLVECKVIETGNYQSLYFYGIDTGLYGGCYQYTGWSGTSYAYTDAFLPQATFTYQESVEPGPGPDPEDPHATGQWLVLFDKDGNEVFVELVPGEGVQVALEYGIYGGYNAEEDPNNPMVPYYFLVDGVRYGAEDADAETHMGDMEQTMMNPLAEGGNNYVIPTGYNYLIGIYTDGEGNMFVMCAQAGWVGVNELVNGKTVAGVRYFNMAGQEMQRAEGLTIVVTTYTDGSSSAVKVMK